jgi:hypothetical protein
LLVATGVRRILRKLNESELEQIKPKKTKAKNIRNKTSHSILITESGRLAAAAALLVAA